MANNSAGVGGDKEPRIVKETGELAGVGGVSGQLAVRLGFAVGELRAPSGWRATVSSRPTTNQPRPQLPVLDDNLPGAEVCLACELQR